MANARNEFIRTSDTLSSHFADFFFFQNFILRGIFFQNRGKKHTFWRGEWGRISAPKTAEKKNTDSKGANQTALPDMKTDLLFCCSHAPKSGFLSPMPFPMYLYASGPLILRPGTF